MSYDASEFENSDHLTGLKPVQILVAEDNQVNMLVIEKYLSPPDCKLHLAEDGRDAVNLFDRLCERGEQPDLILLDIEMPFLSGHDVARHIRDFEEKSDRAPRPIIAVSALSDPECIQESLNAGMNDHLVKPIRKDVLLTSITRILVNQTRVSDG